MTRLLIAIAAVLLLGGHVAAHEWYPRLCCDERDCAPLADGDVVTTAQGYFIRSLGVTVPYAEANTSPQGEQHGAEIKIGPAVCGGAEKAAIYAHPPVDGHSAVDFFVPVPQDITALRLQLAVGIRDGSELADGNLVAFSVRLYGYQV